MSNSLAIATVTETLRYRIQEAVQGIEGATVTVKRPYAPDNGDGSAGLGVNIFLYRIVPNPALRNIDLPTRGARGQLIQKPVVALNLEYLFSFYGEENTGTSERLIGEVVSDLHTDAILQAETIQKVIRDKPYLRYSDLEESPRQVKLTPLSFSTEELFRLWSAFQAPYVPSIGYEARAVLIESKAAIGAEAPAVAGQR